MIYILLCEITYLDNLINLTQVSGKFQQQNVHIVISKYTM